jgi:DNA topoisomerase-1
MDLTPLDPVESAQAAGLRYVSDSEPGIRRVRRGHGFVYLDPDGRLVKDPATLRRIRALAIPPAWERVWICLSDRGHIQAVGRDQKGRKQYRYHPRWQEVRDEAKYGRLLAFGKALPRIRAQVQHDLALPGLPQDRVVAAVVQLLESTLIRIGNEEYAQHNRSYGLTTLRDEHVDVSGAQIEFRFRGKSGKECTVRLSDRRLARIVKRCQDLPGQLLFQYIDEEGQQHSIGSADVNEYLRRVAGAEYSAKDFRTFAGTVMCTQLLKECLPCTGKTQMKKNIVQCIKQVAQRLANTAAVCRRCYIHPQVLEAYQDGSLARLLAADPPGDPGLRPEEQQLLTLLEAAAEADRSRPAARRQGARLRESAQLHSAASP